MFAGQSNTRSLAEPVQLIASGSIIKNRFVSLVDATGESKVIMPTADGVKVFGVALEDAVNGDLVHVLPLVCGREVRVAATGTIAGAVEVMAEITTGYAKTAAGAGTFVCGILIEDTILNQTPRIMPYTRTLHS